MPENDSNRVPLTIPFQMAKTRAVLAATITHPFNWSYSTDGNFEETDPHDAVIEVFEGFSKALQSIYNLEVDRKNWEATTRQTDEQGQIFKGILKINTFKATP